MMRFWRRTMAVGGMTALGQLAVVAAAPVVARLYRPAELGSYAVALALATICVGFSSLRYSLAQTTARRPATAAGLLVLSLAFLVILSPVPLLAALAVSRLGAPGGGRLLDPRLIWTVPVAYIFMGLVDILVFRAIRLGRFRELAWSKAAIPVTVALFQVAAGMAALGARGLMFANIAANLVGGALLLPTGLAGARIRLRARYYRLLIARFGRFPLFGAPAATVDIAANQLTPVLLAGLFGNNVAGQFALVHRVLKQPVALLGLSMSQAFLAEVGAAGGEPTEHVGRFALATIRKLLLLALLPAAAGMLFAPQLFGLVFGQRWLLAGEMARLLLPLYVMLFLYAPFSQILTVRGRLDLLLTVEGARLVAVAGLLSLGAALGLGALGTLSLYGAGIALVYAAGGMLVVRALRRGIA